MTTRSIRKPRNNAGWLHRDWRLYVMLILPVIFYLIFCYKPMVGVIIGFQKFNMFKGMWGSKWIGLENFRFVMNMPDFPVALQNTLWLNFLGLVAGFPVPIILALLLNRIRSSGVKRNIQLVLYMPNFVSVIVVCGTDLVDPGKNFLPPDKSC